MNDGGWTPPMMSTTRQQTIEPEEDEYHYVQIELTDGDCKKFYCEDMDWSDGEMYEFNDVTRNNSGHIEECTEFYIFKKFVRSISIKDTDTNPHLLELEARRQRAQEPAPPTVDHFQDIEI